MQTKTSTSAVDIAENNLHELADYESALEKAVSALLMDSSIEQDCLDRLTAIWQKVFSEVNNTLTCGLEKLNKSVWSGWGWHSIIHESDVRVGLMNIRKDNIIPIHDHPGACGILIVLQGKLRIDTYQFNSEHPDSGRGITMLVNDGGHVLNKAEHAFITKEKGNLHSLKSISDSCIVLDVLLKPYDENERTWFMPVSNHALFSNSFACFRINNQRFSSCMTRVQRF